MQVVETEKIKIREIIGGIPQKPGVYLMKDGSGGVLYVGKAKNLKKRVASYFHNRALDGKTRALLRNIRTVDTIITDNESEALILENNLIKRHRPKYNIELKENNSYPFIKITAESFPRILKTYIREDDGAHYFGPYTHVKHVNRTLKTITDIFPVRRCRVNIDGRRNGRPCLNYYLKKCYCPCCGFVDQEEYGELVRQVILFLRGRNRDLLDRIESEMNREARARRFERAADLRDRYRALAHLIQDQKITTRDSEDEDIFGIAESEGTFTITLMVKRKGKIIGKQDYSIKDDTSLRGASLRDASRRGASLRDDPPKEYYLRGASAPRVLQEFLSFHYNQTTDFPRRILLPLSIDDEQADILESFVRGASGRSIHISVPQRGIRKRLVDLANRNALQSSREFTLTGDPHAALRTLEDLLGVKGAIESIEAFDIATLLGHHSVAGMVRFTGSAFDRQSYRRFRISSVEGQNDVEMIREAVARRYQRLLNEEKPLPDLVLVDGGEPQVNGARGVLDDLGITELEVIGLAKKHEHIHLYGRKDPLVLSKSNEALRLLMAIRDEVHRFANSYHIGRREAQAISSRLGDVKGVGEALTRAVLQALEHHTGPLTLDFLKSIKGLGERRAAAVYEALRAR
jgi:excinuclease ABC subunit C